MLIFLYFISFSISHWELTNKSSWKVTFLNCLKLVPDKVTMRRTLLVYVYVLSRFSCFFLVNTYLFLNFILKSVILEFFTLFCTEFSLIKVVMKLFISYIIVTI